jgi:hypothetical protein
MQQETWDWTHSQEQVHWQDTILVCWVGQEEGYCYCYLLFHRLTLMLLPTLCHFSNKPLSIISCNHFIIRNDKMLGCYVSYYVIYVF